MNGGMTALHTEAMHLRALCGERSTTDQETGENGQVNAKTFHSSQVAGTNTEKRNDTGERNGENSPKIF